jgi:hypothetical protein
MFYKKAQVLWRSFADGASYRSEMTGSWHLRKGDRVAGTKKVFIISLDFVEKGFYNKQHYMV